LLSVGKSDIEAENIIVEHYLEHFCVSNIDIKNFWLTFALTQREWGRLSNRVKEQSLSWLARFESEIPEETASEFKKCLDSPMPPLKRIPRPKWIEKCPWSVGSLLAYRIMSTDFPAVVNGPYWGKYVLLRIVMIKRTPVSRLSPESEWRESMIVGLYDWLGDSIPDPAIADSLCFTPVSVRPSILPENVLPNLTRQLEKTTDLDSAALCMDALASERVETCVCLDWRCAKGMDRKKVFTCLETDPKYEGSESTFFKTDITQLSISHSIPFDVTLAKRLDQLRELDRAKEI